MYKLGPAGYNGLKDLAMWPEGYFLDNSFYRPNATLHLDGKNTYPLKRLTVMRQDVEVQYYFLDIAQLLQTSSAKLPTDTDPSTGLPTEAIKTSLRELVLVGIYKSTSKCTCNKFPFL